METGSIPVISTKIRKRSLTINIFGTTFVNDFFTHSLFVLGMIFVLALIHVLKNSKTARKIISKPVVLLFSFILTIGSSHLASYFLDYSFFIFIGSICTLCFYITFFDYYKKKAINFILTFLIATEVALWGIFVEPRWTVFFIDGLAGQIINAILPVCTIIFVHAFNRFLKWHVTRASVMMGIYFILGSILYTSIFDNKVNWVLSVLLTTILMAIILSSQALINKFLTNEYHFIKRENNYDLDNLIQFHKAEKILNFYTRKNSVKFAPFIFLQFPEIHKTRKLVSYKEQKKSIFKYIRLVEKNISIIYPNSKAIFFEAGYHDIAVFFEIDNLNLKSIEGIIKNKSVENLEKIQGFSNLLKMIGDITFNISLGDKIEQVSPKAGLAFYGYHGEIFRDLLKQASSNTKRIGDKEIGIFDMKYMSSRLFYKQKYHEIKRKLDTSLIKLDSCPVFCKGNQIGEYATISSGKINLQKRFESISVEETCALYSKLMFEYLGNAEKDTRHFITLPSSYFGTQLFYKEGFISKLKKFQSERNIEIGLVTFGPKSRKIQEQIDSLIKSGISVSKQDSFEFENMSFDYIFANKSEFGIYKKVKAREKEKNFVPILNSSSMHNEF